MHVKDVMTRDVASCAPHTNLAEAAWKMWERDCGVLPVVSDSKVVGMITDRDIAIAAATKDRPAREITVAEVLGDATYACHEEDDLEEVLEILSREQVRRLPVVDGEGALAGIVSMNDLILLTDEGRKRAGGDLYAEQLLFSLRQVSRHRRGDGSADAAVPRSLKPGGREEEASPRGRR